MNRKILLLLGLLLCFPAPASGMTPDEFDKKALPLLDKPKDANRLIQICEQALKEGTDKEFEAYVLVVKSHAHGLKKEFAKAEEEALKAKALGTQPELAYTAVMEILLAQGRLDKCRDLCLEQAKTLSGPAARAAAEEDCQAAFAQTQALSAGELLDLFTRDARTAATRFEGKTVVIRGEVTLVDASGEHGPSVVLGGSGGKEAVLCLFAGSAAAGDDRKNDASGQPGDMSYSLVDEGADAATPVTPAQGKPASPGLPRKGDTVLVSGTVRGLEMNRVVLTDCRIAE